MNMTNVGIWGLGTFIPPIVRTNDWWPQRIVDEWKVRQAKRVTRAVVDAADGEIGEGARAALTAAAEYANDPFEGARERRVMPDGMWPTDMQVAAARDAMARAGVGPGDIDFLLVQSTTNDYIHVPDGCRVHEQLGLPRHCFSLQAEAMCNAFIQHLVVADGLIRAGTGRVGLIIQCCVMSRHMRQEDPFSAWFGDGATAAVVGPVSDGKGILAHSHATYGEFHGGLVSGVPDKQWYEDGPVVAHVRDEKRARGMLLAIPDAVKTLADDSIAKSGLRREEFRFFAAHQAALWLGRVVQKHVGLEQCARIDTFPWAASLTGCNLPLCLSIGEKEHSLRDGDPVFMFSGAAGMTVGTLVARWGR
jgi:3-oxoacyl-[acyl-carrier-protein] synthase-3